MTPRKRAPQAPPPAADDRTLPHNLEAERSLLGAILLHNAGYETISSRLKARHFYRDSHAKIYASVARLLERPGGAADLTTIKEDLGRHGHLEEVGGASYLAALVADVPRSTNVAQYAEIVRDKALQRALLRLTDKVAADIYEGDKGTREILQEADRAIVELAHGTANDRMQSVATRGDALLKDLEYRTQHRGELTGIDTAFASINDLTLGWQRGDEIVIAARPSIGKTTMVLNSAMVPASAGLDVALFSFEMKRPQLEYRLISSLSQVPLSRLQRGAVDDPGEWACISQALCAIGAMHLHIDDTAGRSALGVRAACRRLRAECDLRLVIVDYFQLTAPDTTKRGATRNEELTDSSRRYRELADELQVPVIILSQLSRNAAGTRPQLADLRDCGALEQDADIVGFLHRKNHTVGGPTQFILDKARNGPTGTVMLTLNRETTTFIDGGEEPAPPSEAEKEQDERARQRSFFARRAHSR